MIGKYRLVEKLGQGGMGVVFRARHVDSERPAALKTVQANAPPSLLEALRREIGALTRIRHPGVVRIVDHGVEEGRPWYAMDLLEGESLRRFGQRIWSPYRTPAVPLGSTEDVVSTESGSGALPPSSRERKPAGPPARPGARPPAGAGELPLVLRLMRRVCATLAYLHGEGFVNCDLKPENVLIVGDQPVIIDFGLTAHHPGCTGREALEALGAEAGTLPYMSPEQIRGDLLDARS
ncbi:MAG: serine/threonine protein kinase, partial [Myxococcales bacterium]|nr:serine/threonine protein kinase [Myxococcales bacterium]